MTGPGMVSVGRRRNTVRGMVLGSLIGGTAMALVAAAMHEPCTTSYCFDYGIGVEVLAGFGLGAVPGLVVGGLIGRTSRRHVWQCTSLPLSIGVSPVGGGRTAAFVSIAF